MTPEVGVSQYPIDIPATYSISILFYPDHILLNPIQSPLNPIKSQFCRFFGNFPLIQKEDLVALLSNRFLVFWRLRNREKAPTVSCCGQRFQCT
jgi:hypothetical protein